VEEIFDLNAIDNPTHQVLGWCRGVAVMEKEKVWVGFTRIRTTLFKENLLWAKHGFETRNRPTRITLYDLAKKERLDEIDLEPYGLAALFSVHDAAGKSPSETSLQAAGAKSSPDQAG
jgi:predicted Zn-dependent protease with MMP-like domain